MRIILVLSMLLFVAQTVVAAESPSKYALFVGVSKYKHTDMNNPQLEFPEADAKELAEIFRRAGYTVDLLLGKDATQSAIKQHGFLNSARKGFGWRCCRWSIWTRCRIRIDEALPVTALTIPRCETSSMPMDDQYPRTMEESRIEPDPESLVSMEDLLSGLRVSASEESGIDGGLLSKRSQQGSWTCVWFEFENG